MPFFAAIGGVLKVVGKVLKIGGKVVAVTQAAGGAINTATTPYYSEAGQRVQAIMAGIQAQQPPPPKTPAPEPEQPATSIVYTHNSAGGMVGNIPGVTVTAKNPPLPSWLPLAAVGVLLILLSKRR
ncbi:hypothetical protein [Chitinophaga qingshengii]|uniref:Uncharacterized protein n=1 Tax=Chitinophaga qingshengii TaxID=1569794 RepID=A0ABR7TS72_9BACT|nr:hypothetical protein [Chitinophaga qingshengii]MBC9933323.1 hypothetical protein [Chitinophaga qingshengii]